MSESRKMRIPLREWRSKHWEEKREGRLENLATEERDTETIAGMFAEALGNLDAAIYWLERVNAEYNPEQYTDEIRLVVDYGLPHCNPAMDFWLQAEQAEDMLKRWLCKLQRVEPLAPKETEPLKEGTR